MMTQRVSCFGYLFLRMSFFFKEFQMTMKEQRRANRFAFVGIVS